ncbi:hypothetical protein LIER_22492 [Lithospermum erythrorhizon]|uniref:Uncharacterized protein n=1 Tax=Lithospermum erythrorhizon TaxID=34254 RepID=A0AAV3QVE4_LITER
MEEVDFDAMLGERPSFFDRVKIKSKMKPRESMVPADFVHVAPLPLTVVLVPQVRSMLKRIANDIPTSTSNPSKKAKKVVSPKKSSKPLARDSGEEETCSQVGPVVPKATLPTIVVDVASSVTLSDPVPHHRDNLHEGRISLREELNAPFPPKAPSPTSVAQHLAATPEDEVHHREGKAPMPAYDGKYLEIPNLEISLGSPWNSQKLYYHLTRPLFSKKMAAQYKPLRDPYSTLAQSIKHIVQEKEAAQDAAKSWDVERAKLISERDASLAHYNELERAKVADALRVTEALDQANKDRDVALASVASSHLFPDLLTLFNEEKALRPDWYGDLTIDASTPLEEENAEEAGVEEVEEGSEDSSPAPRLFYLLVLM